MLKFESDLDAQLFDLMRMHDLEPPMRRDCRLQYVMMYLDFEQKLEVLNIFTKDIQSLNTLLKHFNNTESDPDENIWSFLVQILPKISPRARKAVLLAIHNCHEQELDTENANIAAKKTFFLKLLNLMLAVPPPNTRGGLSRAVTDKQKASNAWFYLLSIESLTKDREEDSNDEQSSDDREDTGETVMDKT